jgi:hypothetical protein
VLVWVTMIIAGNLSCLGFHTSIIRFIPEYREKGELEELRGIMVASRLLRADRLDAFRRRRRRAVWLIADRIESLLCRALPHRLRSACR